MANYAVKQNFETNLNDIQFENLISKQYIAKQVISSKKEDAKSITRKISIELLALEWFSKIDSSSELKTYLIENFLPVLVLGCEKLLNEAKKKNLVEKNKKDENFNPINYLAQYLMRNNPKYNNNHESNSYMRSMREVYIELRDQMHVLQGNKLAKIKEDVRKRRNDREKQEKISMIEFNRRKTQIEALFDQFYLSKTGRLEIAIIFECIKLYIDSLPDNKDKNRSDNLNFLFPSYCYNRDDLIMDKRLLKTEFLESLLLITENLKNETFDHFTEFFEECTIYFLHLANMNRFKKILKNVLKLIDSTNTGLLSRRRLIKLFNEYKEKSINTKFRNLLEWPVIDPFIKFENKLESIINSIVPSQKASKMSIMKEKTEKELLVSHDDNADEVLIEKPIEINDQNEENKEEEIEKQEEKLAEKVTEDDLDSTEPVPTKEEKNVKTLEKESINKKINLNEVINTVISKDNELLFLKGGKLYYYPIKEHIDAFDTSMLIEKKSEHENQDETLKNDILNEFNPEFVNSNQFVNMISSFLTQNFLNSEIYVNDLIVFIKDNYCESRIEKNSKLVKINTDKKNAFRSKRYSMCFEKLDNEGSGQLSLKFLQSALNDYKEGLFKEQVENAINLIRSEINFNAKSDNLITRNEFFDLISILVGLVDFPKFEDQILNYLSCQFTYDQNEKTRGEVRKKWLSQIKYVGEITCGSFEPLFKQLFFTILKDAENHGMKKSISAYVGILESLNNDKVSLKYVASTPHDSQYVLGKSLTRENKNISFEVIDSSKPEHVQSVRSNEKIHFFNPNNQNEGSLVIFPLSYARNKVFGTIGIDTLLNNTKNSFFYEHELSFYQGVANTFATAYAHIIFKNRLIKTCVSAIEWLNQRCKGIEAVKIHFVQILENEYQLDAEKDSKYKPANSNTNQSINIKPIMKYKFKDGKLVNIYNNKGNLTEENIENKYGSKAYECALVSETTMEIFNGKISFFVPLRNEEHKTVLILELNSNEYYKEPEKYESERKQIETVLYILHKCQEELLDAHFLGVINCVYEYEHLHEHDKFGILFEKSYIKYVIEKLNENLNSNIFEKISAENQSSKKIKNLIELVTDLAGYEDLSENQEKKIDENLINKLISIDSTRKDFSLPKYFKKENLQDLHSLSIENLNQPLGLLADFVCLIENLNSKSKIESTN